MTTGYLLDTNVVSERRRPRPNGRVVAYLDSIERNGVFLSVMTIGELRKGAEIRARSDRTQGRRLEAWIDGLETTLSEAILPIDIDTARAWARLSAARPRPVVDALIAATAIVHDLTLVTRNTRDFADIGVDLVNPWE